MGWCLILGALNTRPLHYLICLIVFSYFFGMMSAFEHSPTYIKNGERLPIFQELAKTYYYENVEISLSGYRAATEYSLNNFSRFLNLNDADKLTEAVTLRLFGNNVEPWYGRIFGFVKGIFTVILLFLIALGLRNKYRVG